MEKAVVDFYGEHATVGICMEECSELIHALSKYNRACGDGYVTDTDTKTAYDGLIKAIADATNAIDSVVYIVGIDPKDIESSIRESDDEALARLE